MTLLREQDTAVVEAAIKRAEKRSAGEVVVGCVPRSSGYEAVRAFCAGLWTVAWAAALHLSAVPLPTLWLLLLQVPIALLAYFTLSFSPVLRLLAGAARCQRQTRTRALQMFAERGVHQTRDRTGLLILVSEMEHQVVILADQGLHACLEQGSLSRFVAQIVAGIKAGTLAPSLAEVIDECGALLESRRPRRQDDRNELSDAVLRS